MTGLGLLAVTGAVLYAQWELSQLRPGRELEGRVGGEQHRLYSFSASDGDLVEVSVEQRGIDLTVSLLDRLGRLLVEVDSTGAGDTGTEILPALIEEPGTYQVEIKATSQHDAPGEYGLRLAIRKPTRRDYSRGLAVREMSRAQSVSSLERAAGYAEQAQDRRLLADILFRQGDVHLEASDREQARKSFERAGEEYRMEGNLLGQAHAWWMQSRALKDLNDIQGAMDASRYAEVLYRKVGGRQGDLGRARASSEEAGIHDQLGNYGLAEIGYDEALRIWPSGLREPERIRVILDLGVLYLNLAQPEQAMESFNEALRRISQLRLDGYLACRKAWALSMMGQAHAQKGEGNTALSYFHQAFGLSPFCKERFIFAATANQVGSIYLDRPAKLLNGYAARLFFQKAYEQVENPFNQTNALGGLAALQMREGNPQEAARLFDEALAARRRQRHLLGIIGALYGRAQAEVKMGNLEAAQELILESLDEIEKLRLGPQGETLSASVLASRRRNFVLSVATFMAQYRREPDSGFDARAFEVSEKARARTLMDWLGGDWVAEGSQGSRAEQELSEQLQALKRQLGQLEDSLEESSEEDGKRQIEALEREIGNLVFKLQAIRASSRTLNLGSSEPWTLQEIQKEVVDNRTLLLSYWFGGGEGGSYLWAVDPTSIVTHVFSPEDAARIQDLAGKVSKALSDKDRQTPSRELLRDLSDLSELVLPAEIASLLGNRRLLIVGDGNLLSIPFQVLQDPRVLRVEPGKGWATHVPLVERHAVITLPSASLLGLLRRELEGRKEPPKDLAAIFDPIFNVNDDRVAGNGSSAEVRSAALDSVLEDLLRLEYSGEEAQAILEMVDPEKRFGATGFDANIDTVMRAGLGDYKFVHFATHGESDRLHDMAGLALAGVNSDLTPRRGFLRAFEISRMNLPVELVVLSACETGVGENVPGEGVFNLSRAFFYAGSRRVVVTLWKVNDEATSEFMKIFYKGLLRDRLEPSEALREAQKTMRSIPQWQHPYFWSGFVLQGEW